MAAVVTLATDAAGGAAVVPSRLAPEVTGPLVGAARLLAADAPGLALARLDRTPGIEAARLRAEAARRLLPGPEADRWRVDVAEALLGETDARAAVAVLAGAEAVLRLDNSPAGAARARRLAAAAIWMPASPGATVDRARGIVVRCLLLEGLPQEAHAAMLRWRLDGLQADPSAAGEMAALLVDSPLAGEALPLVAGLDPGSVARALLQARLGLTPPAEAARRMRSVLPDRQLPWIWRLAVEVGRAAADPVLVAEAGLRLAAAGEPLPALPGAMAAGPVVHGVAERLRADLRRAAAAVASERQLLGGDDFGWLDDAARLAASDPARARALFAGLADTGTAPATRDHARLQLVMSLRETGLGAAALHLLPPPADRSGGQATLPADLARLLGEVALAVGDPETAVRYWRDLPPPVAGDRADWTLRHARALVDIGSPEAAARQLRTLPGTDPDPRVVDLAERMTDAGASGVALQVLEGRGAGTVASRPLLLARARAAEAQGLQAQADRQDPPAPSGRGPTLLPPDAAYAQAASAFLAAAAAGPADSLALEARLRAVRNLERAGLREAARAEQEALSRQAGAATPRDRARRPPIAAPRLSP